MVKEAKVMAEKIARLKEALGRMLRKAAITKS